MSNLKNSLKIIGVGIVILLGLLAVWFLPRPAGVEASLDECFETFEYNRTDNQGDYDDSRVHINFESNDDQIDISAQSGYKINDIYLEVDDVNISGWDFHFTAPLNNFNPNPGGDIEEVRVIVERLCAGVCTDENALEHGQIGRAHV